MREYGAIEFSYDKMEFFLMSFFLPLFFSIVSIIPGFSKWVMPPMVFGYGGVIILGR